MPLTKEQIIPAIGQLIDDGHFGDVTLHHNGSTATDYASLWIKNDETRADVIPTESELEAAYTKSQANKTAEQSRQSDDAAAKQTIQDEFAKDLATIRAINPLTTVNDIKPILERMLKALHANSRG